MRRSVHCVLALCLSVASWRCIALLALYCVVSVVLRLSVALYSSVVFSVMFLQASSVLLLHPYLRCVRSAALVGGGRYFIYDNYYVPYFFGSLVYPVLLSLCSVL